MADNQPQAVQPVRPVVDWAAQLADCVRPLTNEGFPVATWTTATVTRSFITVQKFIDTVKILTQEADREVFLRLISKGNSREAWQTQGTCTPKQLYLYCTWLKSSEGAVFLNECRRARTLEKKAAPGQTLADVALQSALDAQLNELSIKEKAFRNRMELELQDLRRRIVLKEREKNEGLRAFAADYQPAAAYAPMDDLTLGEKCYELYLAECSAKGTVAMELDDAVLADIRAQYGNTAISLHKTDFLRDERRREEIRVWIEEKILELEEAGDQRQANSFVPGWLPQVEKFLKKFELKLRRELSQLVVIGAVQRGPEPTSTRRISSLKLADDVWTPATWGLKLKPLLGLRMERQVLVPSLLSSNARITVRRQPRGVKGGAIPTARSKFEAKVRKVIGGGELRNWKVDSRMYRGGGNFIDALRLLVDARQADPGRTLRGCFTVDGARSQLRLPCGLPVPRGPESVRVKNFNNDATAGPALRAFGVRGKAGLRPMLEQFAWSCLDAFARGGTAEFCLPFVSARVGYRTKLMSEKDAFEKFSQGKPLGRCVMMLDAHEQVFSSALYNVLSEVTHLARRTPESGFRNTIIRASSDWAALWEEVRAASVIVELDWKKFDRERAADDIQFMIDVIISCFQPHDDYERRLLEAHRIMLERSLILRPFITDDGGIFTIDGMVPSGSLWTGWLDTALNILYIRSVLNYLCFREKEAIPKCAGDDNLTLFYCDASDNKLNAIRKFLNEWFLAGIEEEDFIIHRPPFHVSKVQATFLPGVDLSQGTSHILDQAQWVPFDGQMVIDQAAGLSHRWKYVFEGKPKFLSCYWDEVGLPIRPAHINLEKLLWPEGVHTSLDDYEAAVVSMVVDNPFNHHNVNHMMHRYCIIQQVKRVSVSGIKPEHVLSLSHFRSKDGEPVPFPMVAQWRRVDGWVDMEEIPLIREYIQIFKDFVAGVSSLYTRLPTGGLDAWRFMNIIRGEETLAQGQFGNDLSGWLDFLQEHPLTSYLKPTRSLRKRKFSDMASEGELEKARQLFRALDPERKERPFGTVETYADWISDLLQHQ
nr:RNA-dependent RNA polymerase [Cucumis melo amalgavirus 1]